MRYYWLWALLSLLPGGFSWTPTAPESSFPAFDIEVSDYNLLFTDVSIGGKPYRALIDWGDFAEVQLSTELIRELELPTRDSDLTMTDVDGNIYTLQTGSLDTLQVGSWTATDLTFFSANGEIAAVSEQVGTDFQVVLGWGFFAGRQLTLDLPGRQIRQALPDTATLDRLCNLPIHTEYGYLTGDFPLPGGDTLPLLIDTGTPISQISAEVNYPAFETGSVAFQGTEFPVQLLPLACEPLQLRAEKRDLTALAPLGVKGILGVHDLHHTILTIHPQRAQLTIYRAPD